MRVYDIHSIIILIEVFITKFFNFFLPSISLFSLTITPSNIKEILFKCHRSFKNSLNKKLIYPKSHITYFNNILFIRNLKKLILKILKQFVPQNTSTFTHIKFGVVSDAHSIKDA